MQGVVEDCLGGLGGEGAEVPVDVVCEHDWGWCI